MYDIFCLTVEQTQSDSEDESGSSSGNKRRSHSESKALAISDQEKEWRASAYDYETRYCGHCNTTTDIKEANFFGRYKKFGLLYSIKVSTRNPDVKNMNGLKPGRF